jgi:hypothetical protein
MVTTLGSSTGVVAQQAPRGRNLALMGIVTAVFAGLVAVVVARTTRSDIDTAPVQPPAAVPAGAAVRPATTAVPSTPPRPDAPPQPRPTAPTTPARQEAPRSAAGTALLDASVQDEIIAHPVAPSLRAGSFPVAQPLGSTPPRAAAGTETPTTKPRAPTMPLGNSAGSAGGATPLRAKDTPSQGSAHKFDPNGVMED